MTTETAPSICWAIVDFGLKILVGLAMPVPHEIVVRHGGKGRYGSLVSAPFPTFDRHDIFQFDFPAAANQLSKLLLATNDGTADFGDIEQLP